MKKAYIIPSALSADIEFQGIMAGTVTDVGGNGPGYGGGGNGGGRGKDRNGYDDTEDFFLNKEESDASDYSLW